MRVLLVTSEGACGIAEHSAYLKAAVEAADPTEMVVELFGDLRPEVVINRCTDGARPHLVWLNYQAALHSRWTPATVQQVQALGVPVGITYHDTGVPNSAQCTALHAVADAFVVHEPAEDLPGAIYWRQGIPAASLAWKYPHPNIPIVGTVGFAFPWKRYDVLCEAARHAGWRVVLMAAGASKEDVERWMALAEGRASIYAGFLAREEVLARLAGCDATVFAYANANTGTSGAVRQGIAARKPVLLSPPGVCRQFRDLWEDPLAQRVLTWVDPTVEALAEALSQVRIAPIDAGMVALAEQDSWERLGKRYADLYHLVVEDRR